MTKRRGWGGGGCLEGTSRERKKMITLQLKVIRSSQWTRVGLGGVGGLFNNYTISFSAFLYPSVQVHIFCGDDMFYSSFSAAKSYRPGKRNRFCLNLLQKIPLLE